MKLSEFMKGKGLTDESLAVLVREDGTSCDRTTITRLRNGNVWPSRRIAGRIKDISEGSVTLSDLADEVPAEPTEARA